MWVYSRARVRMHTEARWQHSILFFHCVHCGFWDRVSHWSRVCPLEQAGGHKAHIHICVPVWRTEADIGHLLKCFPHYIFLKQSLSLNLEPTDSTRQLLSDPPTILLPQPTQCRNYQHLLPASSFYVGSGHSNQICMLAQRGGGTSHPLPSPHGSNLKTHGL